MAGTTTSLRIGDVIDANDYHRSVAMVFGPPGWMPASPPRPHRIVTLSEGWEWCAGPGGECAMLDRGFWAVPLDDEGNDFGPKAWFSWDW